MDPAPQPSQHPAGRTVADSDPEVEVVDVPEESRYVLLLDGRRIGLMDYAVHGNTFTAIHTEVDPAYSGRGLAERLVTHVLDNVRDTGMALRPSCPYVKRFLTKHPEYDDLVA